MKLLLLSVFLLVVGWYAHEYVSVSYAQTPSPRLSVVLPTVSRPVPAPGARPVQEAPKPAVQAPRRVQPREEKAAPRPLARPVDEEETRATGLAVANNGLWRLHPVRATGTAPGAWSSSPYHGEPRDP